MTFFSGIGNKIEVGRKSRNRDQFFFTILYKLLTEMAYFDLGMDVERYREIFSQSNQQI